MWLFTRGYLPIILLANQAKRTSTSHQHPAPSLGPVAVWPAERHLATGRPIATAAEERPGRVDFTGGHIGM